MELSLSEKDRTSSCIINMMSPPAKNHLGIVDDGVVVASEARGGGRRFVAVIKMQIEITQNVITLSRIGCDAIAPSSFSINVRALQIILCTCDTRFTCTRTAGRVLHQPPERRTGQEATHWLVHDVMRRGAVQLGWHYPRHESNTVCHHMEGRLLMKYSHLVVFLLPSCFLSV